MRGAKLVRRSPCLLGRNLAAVSVDVDPERCSPRYHKSCLSSSFILDASEMPGLSLTRLLSSFILDASGGLMMFITILAGD